MYLLMKLTNPGEGSRSVEGPEYGDWDRTAKFKLRHVFPIPLKKSKTSSSQFLFVHDKKRRGNMAAGKRRTGIDESWKYINLRSCRSCRAHSPEAVVTVKNDLRPTIF